jgi:hypothetical protein
VEPLPDMNEIDINSVVAHIPVYSDKLNLEFVSEADVFKIIKDLPSKNSVSWDGISTKVLKEISLYIVKPLFCIINQSFQEGKFQKI